ncbi:MAG: PilT/PilU family type 4a pilus ATPase [Candidatus Jacksonbacteria bacterium]|jgi:twitching motility protein PilT|nr:PilT/PilU family type 4a pilus ATPase [Candidatus Jacksonbacteria bacterium]MBT6034480.1 PilT/PilU family type 4a pilus ATPase [Candidatus Jacksonbacteria bacterium]MBT6301010.1 PilT/PilU family type 4a pilus ATPase [Candidatus Jacksonbacteria bacterium]MBT6757191.1 PilT/PilU family type 4a pilus ATPase [Candidatus Jacksonbacteria bacterium]MBT6954838.1 PilT/PilU family type 4a pilus ATPase [Candidatus Jacksonbacteria bacterium]
MTIHELLKAAVDQKASDLHLMIGKNPILRIDGNLTETQYGVVDDKLAAELIYSMLSPQQKEKYDTERELDFSYELQNVARFRVNIHWAQNAPGLVARVIPDTIPTMEDIIIPDAVFKMLDEKQGLILVTGPTGQGKSTTMAAMLEYINTTKSSNIVTLEDPIEFDFTSKKSIIKQREIGTDTLTFSGALKRILRQDPNVIMVGEMRDLETIAATIILAETGHLVISTLHTINAAQTIERIIDVFPPHQQAEIRFQLATTLNGIISQRLLPKTGGGRIAARELLLNTSATANLIRENKLAQIKSVLQTSRDAGMVTMDQSLEELLAKNLIEESVAQAYMSPFQAEQSASE